MKKFFWTDLSPTFFDTGASKETFLQSGKQDSFKHVLKWSAYVYDSSGPICKNHDQNTGIQSRPEAQEKPRIFMTLLKKHGNYTGTKQFQVIYRTKD